MNATADWLEFAPPKAKGLGRAFALAIIAHLVLVAALTLGVRWKRDAPVTTVEAELWSAIPKAAAPKLVEAAPPMPPPPTPVVKPPPPAPVVKTTDADIALEREKQRQLDQEKQLAAQKLAAQKLAEEKRIKEKRDLEKKLALEQKRERDLKLAQEKKQREEDATNREALEKKRQLALKEKQQALKAQQQAALEKEESIKLEILRKDNLQRMAGLAGATGGAASAGTAQRSSGPSGSYGSRVSAIVKPNIVFSDDTRDNPVALVEVHVTPDGTISRDKTKLLKSSGNKAWDDAVLKAIAKTAVLPRDIDGTVPPVLEINFRRRD